MAPGKHDEGSLKAFEASTTARAEFCIPTSMLTVLDIFSDWPSSNFELTYPRAKPPACRPTTAARSAAPAWRAAPDAAWAATTDPQMPATASTEASGVNAPIPALSPGAKRFRATPAATGASTSWAVEASSARPSTATSEPTSARVSSGVASAAPAVDAAVIVTERATSAFAIRATKLLAVPPGQHPTNINPAARPGGSLRSLDITSPSKGMIVYWANTPERTT
mmetsp:Transcript_21532/g.32494  ORF Transcript_21532/g.32494 Transcript_21532/m.32494 type:complete len:224 (+) Transcript_21532:354-1025(+)